MDEHAARHAVWIDFEISMDLDFRDILTAILYKMLLAKSFKKMSPLLKPLPSPHLYIFVKKSCTECCVVFNK
jgi:hypothetical protein